MAFRHLKPVALEAYLESMAGKGWALEHVNHRSTFLMTFRKREPATVRYVVELPMDPGPVYRTVREVAGWQYIGRMANERVWRKPYTGARPDPVHDPGTRLKQGPRLAGAVALSAWFLFVGTVAEIVAWKVFGVDGGLLARIDIGFIVLETVLAVVGLVVSVIRRRRRRR
jgi:hypothetical protein